MWQDITIMVVNVVFIVSLVPQVLEGYKKKLGLIRLEASIPTAISVFVLTVVYFTLNLIYAGVLAMILGIIWVIFVIQRFVYQNA